MTPWEEDRRVVAFLQRVVYMDYLHRDCTTIPSAEKEAAILLEIFKNRLAGYGGKK